jgi:hypothetical protein
MPQTQTRRPPISVQSFNDLPGFLQNMLLPAESESRLGSLVKQPTRAAAGWFDWLLGNPTTGNLQEQAAQDIYGINIDAAEADYRRRMEQQHPNFTPPPRAPATPAPTPSASPIDAFMPTGSVDSSTPSPLGNMPTPNQPLTSPTPAATPSQPTAPQGSGVGGQTQTPQGGNVIDAFRDVGMAQQNTNKDIASYAMLNNLERGAQMGRESQRAVTGGMPGLTGWYNEQANIMDANMRRNEMASARWRQQRGAPQMAPPQMSPEREAEVNRVYERNMGIDPMVPTSNLYEQTWEEKHKAPLSPERIQQMSTVSDPFSGPSVQATSNGNQTWRPDNQQIDARTQQIQQQTQGKSQQELQRLLDAFGIKL